MTDRISWHNSQSVSDVIINTHHIILLVKHTRTTNRQHTRQALINQSINQSINQFNSGDVAHTRTRETDEQTEAADRKNTPSNTAGEKRTQHTQMKTTTGQKAWFSRPLQYPARKWMGLLNCLEGPARGLPWERQVPRWLVNGYKLHTEAVCNLRTVFLVSCTTSYLHKPHCHKFHYNSSDCSLAIVTT